MILGPDMLKSQSRALFKDSGDSLDFEKY